MSNDATTTKIKPKSKLTPAERSELRAEAHGLIKVRVFGDDREARVAM